MANTDATATLPPTNTGAPSKTNTTKPLPTTPRFVQHL